MKHFDNYLKNCNIPQLKPEAYNMLMEMLVDLSETNFEKIEVNFPIGKVVFMPQNNIKISNIPLRDIDLNDGDL